MSSAFNRRPRPSVRKRTCLLLTARAALACAAVVVLALSLAGAPARAQSTAQQLAEENRKAMEAYNALELDQAKAQLENAARSAEAAGVRGAPLARTYANLGVVLLGGFGDKAGAIAKFKRALREDPKVEPDPVVATPEVTAAFDEARGANGSGRRSSRGAPRRSAAAEGTLNHAPALEQLTQTAIPVFVEKSAELVGATIKIYYRASGLKKPKSAELQETDDGFTFLIPCSDVLEPVVEYFLVALDAEGAQIGNSGTPEQPIQVPIVDVRSEAAPSLPGQVPPSQCSAEAECTPGTPGCKDGAGLGETCARTADCEAGLVCSDDFCSLSTRGEEKESAARSDKRVFIDLNFGVGATYVGEGRAPDHNAPLSARDAAAMRATDSEGVIDAEKADRELQVEGWDCETETIEDGTVLRVRDCKVAVKPGGFVAVPVLNFAAGYYFTPRFALALTGRFQMARGRGPLAGMLLGARAEVLLTQPAERGFRFGLLGGLGVGQIQARPPAQGKGSGPFATNGALSSNGEAGIGVAAILGAHTGYRFMPNLGFTFTPTLNFGFPNFLFALDVAAGVEVAF